MSGLIFGLLLFILAGIVAAIYSALLVIAVWFAILVALGYYFGAVAVCIYLIFTVFIGYRVLTDQEAD